MPCWKQSAQQVGVAVENARLFQSTQTALGETETLYQASSVLNAVKTFDDILQPLKNFTILGQADKLVSLFLFSSPWVRQGEQSDMPQWAIPVAQWTSLPAENLLPRYSLDSFNAAQLLSPLEPTIVADVASRWAAGRAGQAALPGEISSPQRFILALERRWSMDRICPGCLWNPGECG